MTDEYSNFATIDGIRLHYHDVGSGPAVVMLHGGGPGANGWSNFHKNVPDLSTNFRLLIVDQPGYGLSEMPETTESYWPLTTRLVVGLLDALSLERSHFVGNSLGGGSSIRIALDMPDRVDKVILMGPGGQESLFAVEPTEGIKVLQRFYSGEPTREMLAEFLQLLVFDEALITPELIDSRFKEAVDPKSRLGAERVLGAVRRNTIDGQHFWKELHEIEAPVLLVWGAQDRVVPLDAAFWMLKQIKDVQLHVFSNCGHWAQVEQWQDFNRVTTAFLAD